jgi:hypothetical protein
MKTVSACAMPRQIDTEIQGDQKVSVHLITVQKTRKKYFKQFQSLTMIHSECRPCYNEHGLREHSSACQ